MISNASPSVVPTIQIGHGETFLISIPKGVTVMGFERKMYDVSSMNLKCAQCGKAITELPFQPDGSRPVYCQECNRGRARSGGFRSGGYNRGGYRGR